jgi:hypothetical protein
MLMKICWVFRIRRLRRVSDATRRSHLPLCFDESKRHKHVKKFPLSSLLVIFGDPGNRLFGSPAAVLKPVITEEPVTQTIQGWVAVL